MAEGTHAHPGHSHHHQHAHHHAPGPGADRRMLGAALALLLVFMLGEVVAAWWSGSLALLADAGHMLSDVAALALAVGAVTLAGRPVDPDYTYGWRRGEILAAGLNGLTLLVVGAVLAVQAVRRLIAPDDVHGATVLVVAAVGVLVNLVVAWLVARADRRSLNVEGAYQHILTDLYAYLATLAAGVVILVTGWARADAVAGLVVVALMVRAGWVLCREALQILLEATPGGLDLEALSVELMGFEHVRGVHDLHAWTITSGLVALSVHVEVDDEAICHAPRLLDRVQDRLRDEHGIEHVTVQIEPVGHRGHEHLSH